MIPGPETAMKHFLYLIVYCVVVISCKAADPPATITYYEIRKTGKITVDRNLVQSTAPVCLKIFQFDSSTYLTYFDQTVARIFIHRLEKDNRLTFIDTVSTRPAFKRSYIMDYTLISLDTIALAFNPSYTRDNHDTTLCLINRKGKLLATVDFSDLPVSTGAKISRYGKDTRAYAPNYLNYIGFPMVYHQQLKALAGHFNCYANTCGYHNDSNRNNELHAALLYPGARNKAIEGIHFGLPRDSYYSLNMRYPTGTYNPHSGEMVFSFRYHNLWQVVDTALNVRKIRIESYIVDTIYPLKQRYDEFFDYSRGEFYTIHYNPHSRQYYRFIRTGNNVFTMNAGSDVPPTSSEGKETFILQVINERYELLGETLLPAHYTEGGLLACDKGILLLNRTESSRTGSIVFDIVELRPQQLSLKKYKEKVRKRLQTEELPEAQRYQQYVSGIYKKHYTKNIIIHVDKGCAGCKEYMFSYLKQHITSVAGKDVSVTLITTNRKNLMEKLADPALPANVFIDDRSLYKQQVEAIQTPVLLYYDAGKVPVVTKFGSADIDRLYKLLDQYR
jgi:hypothetical protein